jgi:hypothetical protein
VGSFNKHGNETSASIKGEEFIEQLSDCKLHKKDSDPCNWLS